MVCTVASILQPHPSIHWNLVSGLSVSYTAVIATALGFWGMTVVSKGLPSTISSIGFLGVPVSGVLFSMLFFHESVGYFMLLSMFCIIAGIVCIVFGETKSS